VSANHLTGLFIRQGISSPNYKNTTFQNCILLAYTEDQCTGMVEWTKDFINWCIKTFFHSNTQLCCVAIYSLSYSKVMCIFMVDRVERDKEARAQCGMVPSAIASVHSIVHSTVPVHIPVQWLETPVSQWFSSETPESFLHYSYAKHSLAASPSLPGQSRGRAAMQHAVGNQICYFNHWLLSELWDCSHTIDVVIIILIIINWNCNCN